MKFRSTGLHLAIIMIVIVCSLSFVPGKAMAVSNFTARIDWAGFNADDGGIVVHLITRASISGPVLDNQVMAFQNTDGANVSHYSVSFTPMPQAVVWEIQIQNLNVHTWGGLPCYDSDNVVFNGNNDMNSVPWCTF